MRNKVIFVSVLSLLVVLIGCYTERISNQNLSYLYDRNASFLHPEYNILHRNDSVSELHFRINSNELLYLFNASSNFYSAGFRIRYEVYTQVESKLLIDSSVVIFKDSSLVMEGKTISGVIPLKPGKVKQALVKVDLVDLRRNSHVLRYYDLDSRDQNCRQYFTMRLTTSSFPLARNYLTETEQVVITHASGAGRAKVRYYHRDIQLPKPPFSVESPPVFDYKADSTFTIPMGQPVSFPLLGFYHIQISDSTKHGFTVYRYKNAFPEVKEVRDLIAPLRYINSNSEYKQLIEAENQKVEVDRFWLKLAGNPDRAKLLIQKYYSRVEDANTFFTSFVEGWKTDRGLVYLIFGPPNIIYKNSGSEHWIYGEENNPASLGMTFFKTDNPFTENDFRLDRSPIYKSNWYSAVDMWRQGRVYTDN